MTDCPGIIGVDLSLTSTGVCTSLEDIQAWSTTKKGHEREDYFESELAELVTSIENPYVVIEGYAFGKKMSRVYSIGELGGIVKRWLWIHNVPYTIVPPTVRAKFATGRGNASKAEVVSVVSARTGIAFTGKGTDDMVDAFILYEMGRHHFGAGHFEWPKSQLDVLDKVEWYEL